MASSSFLGSYGPINLTQKGAINRGLSNRWNQNLSLEEGTIGNRNTESGSILSGYKGLTSSGGYSPEEKANIEQGTFGGIGEGYDSAMSEARRRMGITHNAAGYGSILDSLARGKARDLGSAGLQVQSQFADEALKRKMAGLQGLSQLYGVDTSFLNSLGNQQNALLGVGSGVQARSRGVLGTIGAIGSLL